MCPFTSRTLSLAVGGKGAKQDSLHLCSFKDGGSWNTGTGEWTPGAKSKPWPTNSKELLTSVLHDSPWSEFSQQPEWSKKWVLPQDLHIFISACEVQAEDTAIPCLDSWPKGHRGTINVYCFKPPSLWQCATQQYQTNIATLAKTWSHFTL